jgi:hypothetical protein
VSIESAEEFVRLRFSDNSEEHQRAAHESAPTYVWREVIDTYPDARVWVAHNKTVPVAILAVLAGDPDVRVRSMVAAKRKLPDELLSHLATDDDEAVRMAVARHRNASRQTLAVLRNDPWDEIKNVVAERLGGIG